jgi:hypothetical protein
MSMERAVHFLSDGFQLFFAFALAAYHDKGVKSMRKATKMFFLTFSE